MFKIIFLTKSGKYAGKGKMSNIPTAGSFIEVNRVEFEIIKVVYMFGGDSNAVKIVLNAE